jgi:hypothetical protein
MGREDVTVFHSDIREIRHILVPTLYKKDNFIIQQLLIHVSERDYNSSPFHTKLGTVG